MAIKDDTTAANNNQAAAYAQSPSAQGEQTPPVGGSRQWGFFSLGNVGGMSRLPTSEVLTKAMNTLNETYAKDLLLDKPLEVKVLPVDNMKETALSLSSIVVCVRNTTNPALGVSYHTLLLEGSGDPIPSRVESYNGRQVIIDRVAGDVNDKDYAAVVRQIVSRAFPSQDVRAVSGQVVPRTFNWEDKDALRGLAVNGVLPGLTDLETRDPSFMDMDLTKFQRDATLAVQVQFNDSDKIDYAGLPVRNTVSVVLSANAIVKQNAQTVNNQDRSKKISALGGFIDIVWAPEAVVNNPYAVQQLAAPQHKFSARFIMTNLENMLRMTIPSQLLALVTALTLSEGTNWYPYYASRPMGTGGRKTDLRDIGAINIEANVLNEPSGYGTRIDTKAATFTNMELGRLLASTIRPGLTYSLDVSECGSDTWYNEVFAAAAAGAPGAGEAILDAANYLTGGIFAGHYNSGESPVILNEDRIHLGYYIGEDGQKHDVREIDYLAVSNLAGDADKDAPRAFSDTFLRTDYPLAQRLSERKKIISSLVNGEVVYTGFARRATLTAKFLSALASACKAAGLDARVNSPSLAGDYQDQRGVAGFLPQTLLAPVSTGLFNQGFGTQPGGNFMAGRAYGNRWSN